MKKLLFTALSVFTLSCTNLYAQLRPLDEDLFESAQNGDKAFSTTEATVKLGANVNAVDPNDIGNTVLHKAQGRQTITYLLDKGADPLIPNKEGTLPIENILDFYVAHYFSDAGWSWEDPKKEGVNFEENKDLFELLIKGIKDEDFAKLIYVFSGEENSKPLEWLLSVKPSSVDINANLFESIFIKRDKNFAVVFKNTYVTPLLRAAATGNATNVQLLLDNGADDYISDRQTSLRRPIDVVIFTMNKGEEKNNPKYKETLKVLKSFDEKGPLRPAGVKEAEKLLENGETVNYKNLPVEDRETQNNLLFRYAVYSEQIEKPIAAKIALNILSSRFSDLTEYQKQEVPTMGARASYATLRVVDKEFDEAKFKEIARKFIWKDQRNKKPEIETAELARLCFIKVAKICNDATNAKRNKSLRDIYIDGLDVLGAQNGLLDYLYYKTMLMHPGKRTAMISALDLAFELDNRTTDGYWSSQQKNDIKILIESEKNIDPEFRSVIDSKTRNLENRIKKVDFMLQEGSIK